MIFRLPKIATAPFCPPEVSGSVSVPHGLPLWKKIIRYAGPGLLVSVGYMDPGNWATDIEGGSRFGYALLFVVVLSSLAAIFLQSLSSRLGIVTNRDLARLSRETYSPATVWFQWGLAEIAIVACDIAEVLGCALAFKLLLHVKLFVGILLTALDTLIVLGLKGRGFRQIEAIMLGLILTIGFCFVAELFLVPPQMMPLLQGMAPSMNVLRNHEAFYIAVGIIGATIMPHNLYLHSSIVQTREVQSGVKAKREALTLSTIDLVSALFIAMLVNAAILILAASAFYAKGSTQVTDIDQAYHLLEPVAGTMLAPILFAVALFASGQSSTFTGTIAGQIIMDGFLKLRIPCWQRRLITRSLAIIPALIGVMILGDESVGRLLVLSQVVLSIQLPFAIYPLIRFTSSKKLMGGFANSAVVAAIAWALFAAITAANFWLGYQLFT
jgi:manganese transport protein